jgi:hypothetical protein
MVDSSVQGLLEALAGHAPMLSPAIFPLSLTLQSLGELFRDDRGAQAKRLKARWAALHDGADPSRVMFQTLVDFPRREVRVVAVTPARDDVDYTLGSVERCMSLLVSGEEEEVSLAMSRFLSVNGHVGAGATGNLAQEKYRFNEAYQIAYTIKVLISNTPMRLLWGLKGSVELPFESSDGQDLDEVIDAVLRSSAKSKSIQDGPSKKSKKRTDDDSDDNDDKDENEAEAEAEAGEEDGTQKRRKKKRKRGKGKVV